MKITISGFAGEGKSTVAALVALALRERGLSVTLKDDGMLTLLPSDSWVADRLLRAVANKCESIQIETVQVMRDPGKIEQ